MTHEQADKVIAKLGAICAALGAIEDAIRAHMPKPPPRKISARRRRPDPPLPGGEPGRDP